MKKNLMLLVLFAVSSTTFARTFEVAHDIAFMNYMTAEECKADGYKWDGTESDGICLAEGADSVTLKRTKNGIKVTVNTITTNGNSCSYEAKKADFVDPTRLVSSLPTTVYDSDGNATASVCEITVTSHKDHSVSVTTNGMDQCSEFCGNNASLDIENAKNSHYSK